MFLTAFLYIGASKAHILPATFNNGKYSYLEGSTLQTRPKFTIKSFAEGTFQTNFEKWLGSKVPKRDSVILFNAKTQFEVISIANRIFDFGCIPTFFGSGYSYKKNTDFIYPTILTKTQKLATSLTNAANAINEFKKSESGITLTVALADRSSMSDANPTKSLVSNPTNNSFIYSNFYTNLDSEITIVDLSYSKSEDYEQDFFKTDHHWNIKGATKAYTKIMNQAYPNLETTIFEKSVEYTSPSFNGANARRSLKLVDVQDRVSDYLLDASDLSIKIDGKTSSIQDVCHQEKYESSQFSINSFTNRYGEYFHDDKAKIEFNSENHTKRNLLIIGDSYSNNCERFFAKSFDKTIAIDLRYSKEDLHSLISDNKITDVLLLTSKTTPATNAEQVLTKWKE